MKSADFRSVFFYEFIYAPRQRQVYARQAIMYKYYFIHIENMLNVVKDVLRVWILVAEGEDIIYTWYIRRWW